MSKVLSIQVEVPEAISEQSLNFAETVARQAVVIALQQQGELTIREAAAALGLTYEQYLELLAEKDLSISRFEQDPTVLPLRNGQRQAAAVNLTEIDQWLDELSEGTEHVTPLPPDFSRADIYGEHP